MVLVAASDNTSWVCDPSLESYALEQPEMLRSPDYRHKCHAPFKCAPTVCRSCLNYCCSERGKAKPSFVCEVAPKIATS